MNLPPTLKQPAGAGGANLRLRGSVTPETCEPARSSWPDPRDVLLAQHVEQLLSASDPGRLRSVRVEAAGCCVRLSGTVGTYYAKQLAQAAAMSAEGVSKVLNQIEVE